MTNLVRLFSLLIILSPLLVHAAAQQPEKLRMDGNELPLMATPLETYWNTNRPRPAELTPTSWSCWRGYVGTWEIADTTLFLVRIERLETELQKDNSHNEHTYHIPLAGIFGTNRPVPATWFSGVLRVGRGSILAPVNTGFATVYEEDLYLIIKDGKITDRRSVKNDLASLTSESDLAWREFGRIDKNGGVTAVLPEENNMLEKGDWLSQPELVTRANELAKSHAPVEVRGIFFPGRLWFPRLKGQDTSYPLEIVGKQNEPPPGVAVKVTCLLVEAQDGLRLIASAISELPPGFAVQRGLASPANKTNLSKSSSLAADSAGPASNP